MENEVNKKDNYKMVEELQVELTKFDLRTRRLQENINGKKPKDNFEEIEDTINLYKQINLLYEKHLEKWEKTNE